MNSRLEGIPEARKALQEMSRALKRGIGQRALKRGGKVFVDRLQAVMPVSSNPRDPTPGSLKAAPRIVPAKSERGDPRVALLIEDPAAAPGEFGTSKMKKHLRIRPTVDETRDEAGSVINEWLVIEVNAAVARAAKR